MSEIASQLKAAGLGVFPCRQDKAPAVNKGESWKDYARKEVHLNSWPSGVVGVPVPEGTVVIDLDEYKGVTREQVETLLGCKLDWQRALIQRTQSGGSHYAFAVKWKVKQGSNIGVAGLDTRTAGHGYIATGTGYEWQGFGPFALANPSALPALPEASRPLLEHIDRAPTDRQALPEGDREVDQLREALGYIRPDCGRSDWVRVGLALRHQFHDDSDTGLTLFDTWSSGGLWEEGEPHNYDAEGIEHQWDSFKAEGGVTVASLYYEAARQGWTPPPSFDASAAFGAGAVAVDTFNAMVDKITASGGDPKLTDELVREVASLQCSELQRATLTAALMRELKDAGLLTKAIREILEPKRQAVNAPLPPLPALVPFSQFPHRPIPTPRSHHGVNAMSMLSDLFDERMATINGALCWWSGCEWEKVDEDKLTEIVYYALLPDQSKTPVVNGTLSALKALAPRTQDVPRDKRAYFRNCVVDPLTGQTSAHDRNNGNTGTLQTDFTPGANCPQWFQFLESIWGHTEDYQQRVAQLQEVFGWCIIRDRLNIQKIIAFDGASRAGKGVILETLHALLGMNSCGATTFADIHDGKTQSAMRGYDVAIDYEAKSPPRQASKQAIGFMNKLASNEIVSIQLLNKQTPWQGRLNCKMIISCNGVPAMLDDSGATVKRLQLINFCRSFEDHEQDKHLAGKLLAELPGIALWALDGAARLIRNDGRFTQSDSSTKAVQDLSRENQPLTEFISEYLDEGLDYKVHRVDVWETYRKYCIESNEKLPSRSQFYRNFEQTILGSRVEAVHSIRIGDKVAAGYRGLQIKAEHKHPFSQPLEVVK